MITASLPVLPNVWLGTSVESADYLGRIDDLRKVDAAVRFVSFEPLLGSVARADLTRHPVGNRRRRVRPASRPMEERWVAEIVSACRKAGTAFFFKQWGGINKKPPAGTIVGVRSMRCRAPSRPEGLGRYGSGVVVG